MSGDLLGIRPVGATRDPLDRFFTPDALCNEIARHLWTLGHRPKSVTEPSVGGGSFMRAARRWWPLALRRGVDIDPDAEGFRDCDEHDVADWLTCDQPGYKVDLILGNPPFTGTKAIAHVERCLEVADAVALILPWAPLGGVQAWDHLMDAPTCRPVMACPIVPRPWPANVRETALYVWDSRVTVNHTIIQRLQRWK